MAQPKILPSAAFLQECFIYDPDTGVLTWKQRPREHFSTKRGWAVWNGKYAGTIAGTISPHGYRIVADYRANRVIWKMMTGEDPPNTIDHANGDKLNNRWLNLRAATQQEQLRNQRSNRNTQSGHRGVRRCHSIAERWEAYVYVSGTRRTVGTFDTISEAAAAREAAARELHGEFYRRFT